uniref:Uncharacterized protein n=1 Tax=Stegastes partitus TaxID=144197 RepID=A0A3B5AQ37_9TELE
MFTHNRLVSSEPRFMPTCSTKHVPQMGMRHRKHISGLPVLGVAEEARPCSHALWATSRETSTSIWYRAPPLWCYRLTCPLLVTYRDE